MYCIQGLAFSNCDMHYCRSSCSQVCIIYIFSELLDDIGLKQLNDKMTLKMNYVLRIFADDKKR